MIARRRVAEDQDDLTLFLGALPQPPPRAEELDELGRVVPQTNPTASRADRTAAREARRIYRRAAGRAQQEEEGYSTDSSLPPSDAEDYKVAKSKLMADGREIMADVKAEEFRNPEAGLGKWFDGWRTRFADIYTGAWGGLGMVGAWEFWVRLAMMGWSPFEVSSAAPSTLRRLNLKAGHRNLGALTRSSGTTRCTGTRVFPIPTTMRRSWGRMAISFLRCLRRRSFHGSASSSKPAGWIRTPRTI